MNEKIFYNSTEIDIISFRIGMIEMYIIRISNYVYFELKYGFDLRCNILIF